MGRPAGRFVLRGKSQALEVLEPLTPDRAASPFVKRYLEAYRMLENGQPDAIAAFESLAESTPGDALTEFYLGRLRAGQAGTTITLREK